MNNRVVSSALATAALLAGLAVGGCGGQSCKEAQEGSAKGESCDVIHWHETHEGPSVYNNFHSTR